MSKKYTQHTPKYNSKHNKKHQSFTNKRKRIFLDDVIEIIRYNEQNAKKAKEKILYEIKTKGYLSPKKY